MFLKKGNYLDPNHYVFCACWNKLPHDCSIKLKCSILVHISYTHMINALLQPFHYEKETLCERGRSGHKGRYNKCSRFAQSRVNVSARFPDSFVSPGTLALQLHELWCFYFHVIYWTCVDFSDCNLNSSKFLNYLINTLFSRVILSERNIVYCLVLVRWHIFLYSKSRGHLFIIIFSYIFKFVTINYNFSQN